MPKFKRTAAGKKSYAKIKALRKAQKKKNRKGRKTIAKIAKRVITSMVEPKIVDQVFTLDPEASAWAGYVEGGANMFAVPIDPILSNEGTAGANKWYRRFHNDLATMAYLSTAPTVQNWRNVGQNLPLAMVKGNRIKRTGFMIDMGIVYDTYTGSIFGQHDQAAVVALNTTFLPAQNTSIVYSSMDAPKNKAFFTRLMLVRAKKGASDLTMLNALNQYICAEQIIHAPVPPDTCNVMWDSRIIMEQNNARRWKKYFRGKAGSENFDVLSNPGFTWANFQKDNLLFLVVMTSSQALSGTNLTQAMAVAPHVSIRIRSYWQDL